MYEGILDPVITATATKACETGLRMWAVEQAIRMTLSHKPNADDAALVVASAQAIYDFVAKGIPASTEPKSA